MARKKATKPLVCPECGWSADGFWALCQVAAGSVGLPLELGLGFGPSCGLATLRCGACRHEFEAPASMVPRLAVE
jgi:predicted RNA-binding Zn-ribbon protein involved in translation (DUF1610 family)